MFCGALKDNLDNELSQQSSQIHSVNENTQYRLLTTLMRSVMSHHKNQSAVVSGCNSLYFI